MKPIAFSYIAPERNELQPEPSSFADFMKNIRAGLSLALIIVFAVVFTSVYSAAGQNKPTVSKKGAEGIT